MRWMFFVQSTHAQLLLAVASILDAFREDIQDPVEIKGRWLDREAGVYVLEIDDVLLSREFDAFLDINPEYDTYQECPEVAEME
jgi:hypothetical protein